MCFSKAPKVKPVAAAPTVGPEVVDDTAVNAADQDRKRRRQMYGRQATILAGGQPGAASPTGAAKTALGS